MKRTTLIFILLFHGFTLAVVDVPAAGDRMVKVAYFVPRDRPFQQHIPTALNMQIKAVQRLYADQMEAHGHSRKTFNIENDANGKLVVYRIIGNFNDAYYHTDTLRKVTEEIDDHHDIEKHIYIVIVDVSTERIQGNCGIAYFDGGPVMVAATGDCTVGEFGITLIAHELGHALNLEHDFRDESYIMSYGATRNTLSACAASMLNVSPFFNQGGNVGITSNTPASIHMRTPSTYSANAKNWALQFSVSDVDGIHQVQFLLSVPGETTSLMSCQNFNNTRSTTVEFDMPTGATIAPVNNVYIRVVDQNGYVSGKSWTLNAIKTIETKTVNTNRTETYLTLNYDSPDALVPTNNSAEWVGWKSVVWEKTPDGLLARRPNHFLNPDLLPFFDEWDYWFYSHAQSRIVYNLGGRNYTKFDSYFYMPNPCGSIASVEVICFADNTEIYNSGILRGTQAQNVPISFDIPVGTRTLIINVTDAGDGAGCDHFIFANARLVHGEPFIIETINREKTATYLTLDYSSPDALVPTNARAEWTGWNNLIREKTPDGQLPKETQPFSDRPFWAEWDYWFYSHAQSHIVYNLTGGKYAIFDAYFHMPNPCGSIASVEVILVADNDPIYNSGILKADQAQNMNISVDIPAGTRDLSIYVTDAGDGGGCDHFIFANARLVHGDPLPRKAGPKIAGPKIAGPKITGPWLWMLAPTEKRCGAAAVKSEIDFLAEASGGSMSELQVATYGVMEGDTIGNHQWTSAKISPSGGNNINTVMNVIGLGVGNIENHVAYGCITLGSPKTQNTTMYVGSDDAVKVWLNGTLVHNNPIDRASYDYQESFPVTLEQGTNILLVSVYECGGGWTGFFGFEKQAEYTILPPRLGFSFSTTTTNVRVGDTFMLHLNSEKVARLAGWQFDIVFDPAVLEALEVNEGDFLKKQGGVTFFRQGRIDNAAGKITGLSSALISDNGVSGTGTILSVTFFAKAIGETQVTLRNFEFGSISGKVIPVIPYEIVINVGDQPAWDVNQDGRVSILDLILVARRLGEKAPANSEVDVNDDGVISILDLIIIAHHIGESTATAPSTITIDSVEGLNPTMLQAWVERARIEDDGSIAFRQGIESLQRLLESLVPEKTTLLANYPNPFNPETWIPYQLAEPAEVSISIYAADGKLVRTLELGHQSVGIYKSRSHAAHWDGRNEVGEPVASGLYFYTLTAGKSVATRRMLIRK